METIIWTNDGLLSIAPSRTREIWTEIQQFSPKDVHLKMPSAQRSHYFVSVSVR